MPDGPKKAWNVKYPKLFLPIPRDSIVLSVFGGGGFYMLACDKHAVPGSIYLILTETAHSIEDEWESFEDWIVKEFLE